MLRPCDILLSRGTTEISEAIVAADGGSYSHAALFAGHGIVEATLSGVAETPLSGDRDVYRFKSETHRLPAEVSSAIIRTSLRQVGGNYATGELVLLASLFAVGAVPERSARDLALRCLGRNVADRLEDWIDLHLDAKAPRVCSELVAIAYYRASRRREYALRVVPRQLRAVEGEHCRSSDGQLGSNKPLERKILGGNVAVSTRTERPIAVITPGDIQFSPSLTFVGRLQLA